MNLPILWIDFLVIALVWVVFWAACSARLKRRWARGLIMTIAALVPCAAITGMLALSAVGKFSFEIDPNYFGFCVSLAAAFLVCFFLLLRLAFRQRAGAATAAENWQPIPWMLVLLAAVSVGYMVLLNMDLAVRSRCAIASLELRSDYLAMLPAVTSEENNAAPLYDEAFARLQAVFDDERRIRNPPTGVNDTFDPDEPATISYLNKVAPTIALLRQAASLPACRFDADLRVRLFPLDKLLDSLSASRNAVNVLALDAYEADSQGNIARALDDVTAILRMSRHIGQRPFLVSALTGIGQDAMGHQVLKQTLPLVTSKDQFGHLHLDHMIPLSRIMRLGLISGESLGTTFYGDMVGVPTKRAPGMGLYQPTGIQGMVFRALLLDVGYYLDFMNEYEDGVSRLPYMEQRRTDSRTIDPRHNFLTAILAPGLDRLTRTLGRGEANDSCGQIAVAMTRYRLDHGSWPTELSALTPKYLAAIPIDPFDGKPLRLVTRGGIPTLYSVDVDGVDDGGVNSREHQGKGDWTYTLEPATRPTTKPSP